jgi:hypothetical protein
VSPRQRTCCLPSPFIRQTWPLMPVILYLISVASSAASDPELPSTEVIVLSPAHSLRRITTTVGKSHASPTSWRNSVENLVAPLVDIPDGWKSPVQQTFTTPGESLGLWFRDDPATQPGTKGVPMPVAPSIQARFLMNGPLAGFSRANGSVGPWSALLLLDCYPRRIPEFTVHLTAFDGQSLDLKLLRVRNPSPRPDAGWRSTPLPARVGDSDSALILHDLTVTATPRARPNGERWVRVQTRASWSAANTSNVPRIVAARLRDPGGNQLPLYPSQTPPHERTHSLSSSGSLFFDEPVWQLELLTPDHSVSTTSPDILPAGPIGIHNQSTPDADSAPQTVPLLREVRSSRSSAAVSGIAVRSTSAQSLPGLILHFGVESIPPDQFLELTSVTDDLDRSWSLASPFVTIDAHSQYQIPLVPPPPEAVLPKHFRIIFTVRPTRTHILRITPRFLGPDLLPTDLSFPFRPSP